MTDIVQLLLFELKREGAFANPQVKRTTKPKLAPPHLKARTLGVADGIAGQRRNAHRWPSGVYGHADYELGYAQGEQEVE